MQREAVIKIPLQGSEESVLVPVDELPPSQDILSLLKTELPPLNIWLKLAVEYYRHGMMDDFQTVVEAATSEGYLFKIQHHLII